MFTRSSSGIKNADIFYKGEYLVYVEGNDDKLFWSSFFPEKINGYKCKLKPVGGFPELKKYIDILLKEKNSQFAVATDSDYRKLQGKLYKHPKILETETHSIENIILLSYSIYQIIQCRSKETEYPIDKVEKWLDHFNQETKKLMILDFLIQRDNIGQKCLKDNCLQFLKSPRSKKPIFDQEKINNFIKQSEICTNLLDQELEKYTEYLPCYHIRGHFFASAVLCFVNHEVSDIRKENDISNKPISISKEDFIALANSTFKNIISDSEDLQQLRGKANSVAETLVNNLEN
ncbi:putative orphan protein [Geminocystis sp. NIES-3708]|uniref:DUF4435 domain-containing protein n=1 Tax=Geminocystis sp. NIES-3708 TaxID=1615909 RepID=UPI0005FC6E63|nr:DUF4435 domain-containing protein [Geminocystis sp. NIES-3708]BAQ62046.1 putative orphan protein [Geminocystis sp. NIES-3708]